MNILGILLVGLGVLGLFYQGVTFWTRKKIIDAGPIQIDGTTPSTVWIPPAVSIGMLVTGAVLLLIW